MTAVPGVGPARAALLARLGVDTVGDLLALLPRRYEDRRSLVEIADLEPGRPATFTARVARSGTEGRAHRRRRFRATFEDETGRIDALWFRFRAPHLGSLLEEGALVLVHGAPKAETGELLHPEVERLDGPGGGGGPGIRPVYPATAGLSQGVLRGTIRRALAAVGPGPADPVPVALRARLRLAALGPSLAAVHAPPAGARTELLEGPGSPWRRRILFEELLALQLRLARRRRTHAAARPRRPAAAPAPLGAAVAGLPFALTAGQRGALREIARDIAGPQPMQRLLQGDVGSGKTVVAALAARLAVSAGGQAAIMVPTALLAEQHWTSFRRLAGALGFEAALLTRETPAARRREIVAGVRSGSIPLLVGTHALLGEGVRFARLSLVVVDEQHRFGVRQRLRLREKGEAPDLLVMTATPIPRSLALALYGDLDLSVIAGLPPGRTPVRTEVLGAAERPRVIEAIRAAVGAGGRVFVVCPLAEAGEEKDPASAVRTAEALRRAGLGLEVGVVHGALPLAQRTLAMERLRSGATPVLVATTVIEVGIDVPEATLMVVEGADRFGLSQLHQLRGRVGRGPRGGRCLLVAGDRAAPGGRERLEILARTDDGFAVAEADLLQRGPGELAGLRQAGEGGLRIADLGRDRDLLEAARELARQFVATEEESGRGEPLPAPEIG